MWRSLKAGYFTTGMLRQTLAFAVGLPVPSWGGGIPCSYGFLPSVSQLAGRGEKAYPQQMSFVTSPKTRSDVIVSKAVPLVLPEFTQCHFQVPGEISGASSQQERTTWQPYPEMWPSHQPSLIEAGEDLPSLFPSFSCITSHLYHG